MPVRLEPAAPRVKHSTTEPLRSHSFLMNCLNVEEEFQFSEVNEVMIWKLACHHDALWVSLALNWIYGIYTCMNRQKNNMKKQTLSEVFSVSFLKFLYSIAKYIFFFQIPKKKYYCSLYQITCML